MTDHTPLSPAAQAVLDACEYEALGGAYKRAIAAALRAAADQVVPDEYEPDTEDWTQQSAWIQANFNTRFKLLKIAAELDDANPSESD